MHRLLLLLSLAGLLGGALLTGCANYAPASMDTSQAFARVSLLFNS